MNLSPFDNAHIDAFSKSSGRFLLWGILLVILGLVAICAATMTTLISVIFLSFLFLVGGVVIIVDAFTFWWRKGGGFLLHLLLGVLYFAVGIMIMQSPILASVSITMLIGVFYLVIGIMRIIYSLSVRSPKWGWSFFNALISLILGVLILSSLPESGLFIIGLFVGIDLLFTGWTYIIASLAARALTK